jgi:dipeptidyl aminopeptidase/acylaminoacyl peptidase
MEYLTLLGYAVVQPDAPIFGEQGRMNDNYVHDLRNNLAAVIDHLDREGIIDRDRLGVGGHSYGAFRPSTPWCTRRSSRPASRATATTTAR